MKVIFLSELELREISPKEWLLLTEFKANVHKDDWHTQIVVPKGFRTDLASVPRLPLAYLLAGDKARKSALLHDWLYSVGWTSSERKFADDVFLAAMESEGIDFFRYAMYAAVRLFGGGIYEKKSSPFVEELPPGY